MISAAHAIATTGTWVGAALLALAACAPGSPGSDSPPDDADVLSQPVPVGVTVVARQEWGTFRVKVQTVQCDWYTCTFAERVTNIGKREEMFRCDEQYAITAEGARVMASWVGLGNNGVGCLPPMLPPGTSSAVDVRVFGVDGRRLVRLIVAGESAPIALPPVVR